MSDHYKDFIKKEIRSRKTYYNNRRQILKWGFDKRIPFNIIERYNEIRLNAVLGLDHNIMKLISLFVEYVLMQIVISHKLKTEGGDYRETFKQVERKGLYDFLKILSDEDILHQEDYDFCLIFANTKLNGENKRNIEIHHKEVTKTEDFEPAFVSGNEMDEFTKQVLKDHVTNKPGNLQIGSRIMNENDVVPYIARLCDLIDRNVEYLSYLK